MYTSRHCLHEEFRVFDQQRLLTLKKSSLIVGMKSVLMMGFSRMWFSMLSWGGVLSLEVLFEGGVGYILESSETATKVKKIAPSHFCHSHSHHRHTIQSINYEIQSIMHHQLGLHIAPSVTVIALPKGNLVIPSSILSAV